MKKRTNIPLIIGIILLLVGSFLPSIKIADENINFIKEAGPIIIILAAIMIILLKLDKKLIISIPSILSIGIIIKFITKNTARLKTIRDTYKCYTGFQYGLTVMMIGNILIIIALILTLTNFKTIFNKVKEILEIIKEKLSNIKIKKPSIIKPALIEKISKKENKKKITTETTKDGKIKFNKITVKVDNKEKPTKLKEKLNLFILKHRLKKISKKKLSITKYKEEPVPQKTTYYVPRINIRKWTRNNVCCINCGATIKSTSEYCFLCDCKIKLQEKEEKLS